MTPRSYLELVEWAMAQMGMDADDAAEYARVRVARERKAKPVEGQLEMGEEVPGCPRCEHGKIGRWHVVAPGSSSTWVVSDCPDCNGGQPVEKAKTEQIEAGDPWPEEMF